MFQVASCWNGVVVFQAGLVAWRGEAGQGEDANGGGEESADDDVIGGETDDEEERPGDEDDVAGKQDPNGEAVDGTNVSNASSSVLDVGNGTTLVSEARTMRKRGWQMVDNGAFFSLVVAYGELTSICVLCLFPSVRCNELANALTRLLPFASGRSH